MAIAIAASAVTLNVQPAFAKFKCGTNIIEISGRCLGEYSGLSAYYAPYAILAAAPNTGSKRSTT
jgi:hypothetical protein